MRYLYLVHCYFLIRGIKTTLINIIVDAGGDVQILQLHTTELYVKMKDIYAPSPSVAIVFSLIGGVLQMVLALVVILGLDIRWIWKRF